MPEKNGWLTPKDSNRPFRIDHTDFEDLWSFGNIMRNSRRRSHSWNARAPTSNPRVNAGKTGGFFNRQSPNTGKLPRFLAATAVGDSTSRSGPHKICCAGNKPAVQAFRLGRLRQTLPRSPTHPNSFERDRHEKIDTVSRAVSRRRLPTRCSGMGHGDRPGHRFRQHPNC